MAQQGISGGLRGDKKCLFFCDLWSTIHHESGRASCLNDRRLVISPLQCLHFRSRDTVDHSLCLVAKLRRFGSCGRDTISFHLQINHMHSGQHLASPAFVSLALLEGARSTIVALHLRLRYLVRSAYRSIEVCIASISLCLLVCRCHARTLPFN